MQKKSKKICRLKFYSYLCIGNKKEQQTNNIMKYESKLDKVENALEFVTIGFCVLVMVIVFLGL